MLVLLLWSPHPSNSILARPLERHCRPTHSHTGTQGHSVTRLKLRGKGGGEIFQCLLLGTPGTQAGTYALGGGRLALKESSMGAGGYIHRDYVQRRGMPPLSPQ